MCDPCRVDGRVPSSYYSHLLADVDKIAEINIPQEIHGIYDLPMRHRVEDFLVTDRATLRQVEAGASIRDGPEKLLFSEHHGELLMSLYLDAELVGSLEAHNPFQRLDRDNLAAFCLALEGVSHFVYLSFNAGHERPVSQLELELQAEVDKFVVAAQLLARQRGGVPSALHDRLFRHFRLVPGLDDEQRRRYLDASRYASDYCRMLASRFMAGGSGPPMVPELRHFYRLTQRGKLHHIASRRT